MDVDGVVSPFGLIAETDAEKHGWIVRRLGREQLIIPDAIPGRLQRLEHCFECVLATTYEHQAGDLSETLGTKKWDAVRWTQVGGQDWKWKSLLAYARGRSFAWIDDEIGPGAYDAAAAVPDDQVVLPLLIDPSIGLTDQQVQQLVSWAAGL